MGSTRPREENWGATWMKKQRSRARKLRLTALGIISQKIVLFIHCLVDKGQLMDSTPVHENKIREIRVRVFHILRIWEYTRIVILLAVLFVSQKWSFFPISRLKISVHFF
jgi:hypothetical protein